MRQLKIWLCFSNRRWRSTRSNSAAFSINQPGEIVYTMKKATKAQQNAPESWKKSKQKQSITLDERFFSYQWYRVCAPYTLHVPTNDSLCDNILSQLYSRCLTRLFASEYDVALAIHMRSVHIPMKTTWLYSRHLHIHWRRPSKFVCL